MTVVDISGSALITVEVLKTGPRPGTLWVRALGGLKPFTRFTHGGPVQDGTALVILPQLRTLEENTTVAVQEGVWMP